MTAEQLARRFSSLLRNCLSHAALAEAIKLNAEESDPAVCHTHDNIDANMIMADAFTQTAGRDIDLQSDADRALWSEAWTLAKQTKFYTCPARELKPGMKINRHGVPAMVVSVTPWIHPVAGAVVAIKHLNPYEPDGKPGLVSFQTSALVPLS